MINLYEQAVKRIADIIDNMYTAHKQNEKRYLWKKL